MRITTKLAALGVTGLLTLVACGGSGNDSPAVTGAQTASSTTVAAAAGGASTTPTTAASTAATGATTPTTAAPATAKVSANNATQAEIAAALDAAGVANAARWAVEVVEYRPYPTNDPTFAKLRQNLVKYNPAPGLVDQIVAALSL
jgi:7-cyano-7-deazaguanine synthase in queuosine biosynthesis